MIKNYLADCEERDKKDRYEMGERAFYSSVKMGILLKNYLYNLSIYFFIIRSIFMQHTFKILILTTSFIAQAGTVVYAPIPKEAHDFIEFLKNCVQERVEAINQDITEQEGKYIFDGGKYPPHLTLMYGADDLTMEEINQKAPGIENTLQTLADNTLQIDVTQSLQNAQISNFQGNPKWPKEIDGKKYQNFKVLIIHMANNDKLIGLASEIRSIIAAKHKDFKLSELPFNAHLTIGWLLNKNDINPEVLTARLETELKPKIEDYIKNAKNPFVVRKFILSAHDKLQKEFELNGSK